MSEDEVMGVGKREAAPPPGPSRAEALPEPGMNPDRGRLTAALNWARANLAPRMPGPQPSLPPVQAPVLGIWSDADHYLDGERTRQSAAWVAGPWRYAEIAGASHWVPRDAPGQLNDLLLDWLR